MNKTASESDAVAVIEALGLEIAELRKGISDVQRELADTKTAWNVKNLEWQGAKERLAKAFGEITKLQGERDDALAICNSLRGGMVDLTVSYDEATAYAVSLQDALRGYDPGHPLLSENQK